MIDQDKIAEHVRAILTELGEDVNREGLLETPHRVAAMFTEIFANVKQPKFEDYKIFTTLEDADDGILITDIPFYTTCEHHLLPFFGSANIAYIPAKRRIIGLSKIHRLVEHIAHKPNVQENMTIEIARNIEEILQPLGIAVQLNARHMCIEMRGVRLSDSITKTSYYLGEYKKLEKKQEFLQLIK